MPMLIEHISVVLQVPHDLLVPDDLVWCARSRKHKEPSVKRLASGAKILRECEVRERGEIGERSGHDDILVWWRGALDLDRPAIVGAKVVMSGHFFSHENLFFKKKYTYCTFP